MQCNPMQRSATRIKGNRGNAMQTLEVIPQLSFEDLRQELERVRGTMPKRTLYHWIAKLGIIPAISGYYTPEDLEILKRLNRFLQRTPSIEKFKQALVQEMNQCL